MPSVRLLSRPFFAAFLNGRSSCTAHRISTPNRWENIATGLNQKHPSCRWMASSPDLHTRNSAPIFCVKAPQSSEDIEGLDVDGDYEESDQSVDSDDLDREGGSEEPEQSFAPSIQVGESEWAKMVLKCVQQVLAESHSMENLDLFSFKVKDAVRKVEIRLDKRDNEFGSPGLEDIQEFSKALTREMEDELGEEQAGLIEVEASSPGAEREVRLPEELDRFKHLPMQVEYLNEDDETKNQILNLDGLEKMEGVILKSRWKLADTKMGRFARKGRGLNKKDRERIIELKTTQLRKVNLYLDV
ncbi:hypothetical protein BSKO_12971 [Bryopsis sp. KO-2023]|nr:hypothetical protein BSKO_12971 [Bryopsis sp. KO-2023]